MLMRLLLLPDEPEHMAVHKKVLKVWTEVLPLLFGTKGVDGRYGWWMEGFSALPEGSADLTFLLAYSRCYWEQQSYREIHHNYDLPVFCLPPSIHCIWVTQ